MLDKEKEQKILVIEHLLMPEENNIALTLSFFYKDFTEKYGRADKELLDYSRVQMEHSHLFQTPDGMKNIRDALNDLNLQKDEYSEIVLDVLYSKDRYGFGSNRYMSDLFTRLLGIKSSDSVMDIGSGKGNFLAFVASAFQKETIRPSLFGIEIDLDSYFISKMALTLCDANFKIAKVNALSKTEIPSFTKGFVFPPFGIYTSQIYSQSFNHLQTELFNTRTSAEWLFVFKALEGLAKGGKVVAILPEGVLFKAQDAEIRKYLIENGLIEGIISLPMSCLDFTGIRTDIIVFSYGNQSFRLVNGEEVLKGLPVKGINSHEAVVDLYNAYTCSQKIIEKKDIKSLDYNLTYASLSAKNLYEGMKDLVRIGDIAEIIKGPALTLGSFKDQVAKTPTPYQILTSSDISDGIIDLGTLTYIGDGKKFEKYRIHKGDIVMTSKSTKVKFASIIEEPKNCVIVTGGMIIIRPDSSRVDGTYFKIFFDSARGKALLASIQKGSLIVTIPAKDFENLKFPCPAMEEQKAAAKKYNNFLAVYDGMKKETMEMEKRLANFFEEIQKE